MPTHKSCHSNGWLWYVQDTDPVAHIRDMRNAYKILVGKRKCKSPLRRPKHIWKDNIKVCIKQIGFEDMDRILLI
jgi:hypothetical protein